MEAISASAGKPLSLEVVADDLKTMTSQGLLLGSWGPNVVVKIPITTTQGESCLSVVRALLDADVKVNVTAILTDEQVEGLVKTVMGDDDLIVSVFAGRIADTGRNPESIIKKCVDIRKNNKIKILWASTREFYNIIQAQNSKCDIITITPEIYAKKILKNYNLEKYSTETSLMFYNDAKKLNLNI